MWRDLSLVAIGVWLAFMAVLVRGLFRLVVHASDRWLPPAFTVLVVAMAALLFLVFSSTGRAAEFNFPRSVANVLVSEGGYTNDRADPGGPTNFGITIYDVRKYLKPNATAEDVKRLTKPTAVTIYHDKYWLSPGVRGPELQAGVDYSTFDYGVNSGVQRSGKVLRCAIQTDMPLERCVKISRTWQIDDPVLLAALTADPVSLIRAINAERLRFLKSLHTWPVFGKGWEKRVRSVERISLLMATAPMGILSAPDKPARSRGKAYPPPDEDEEADCPPAYMCNGQAETNSPRCCP